MDNQLQTSFIPKQSTPNKIVPEESKTGGSLIGTLSLIILLASAILAAGAFGFKFYLANSINKDCPDPNQLQTAGCGLVASLEVDKRNLDESLLNKMLRFDSKIRAGTTILNNHQSLIPFFDLLGNLTLKTVRYTSFSLKGGEVTLGGLATNYEDVAVQQKVFETNKNFINPQFSGLDLDPKGNVSFKVTFKVLPELLSYARYAAALTNNQNQ